MINKNGDIEMFVNNSQEQISAYAEIFANYGPNLCIDEKRYEDIVGDNFNEMLVSFEEDWRPINEKNLQFAMSKYFVRQLESIYTKVDLELQLEALEEIGDSDFKRCLLNRI